MAHDLRQLAGDCTIDVLDDVEVGREEDIKIALVDLVLSAAILFRKGASKSSEEELTKGVETGTVRLM